MTKYEAVLEQARTLSDEEQERLVVELVRSLASDYPLDDPEWDAELARRLDSLDSDPGATMSWPEARKIIFGH